MSAGCSFTLQETRYHLNEFSGRNYLRTAQEMFNLRHSSLRVIVERAFGALKNRFKILDQKPFHSYSAQVKLVLVCCILHNWILHCGFDEHVPEEEEVELDDVVSSSHGVEAFDNDAWKKKKGWSGQRQCGLIEVSAGFEEEEEAEAEAEEEEDLVVATPMNYPLFSEWLLIICSVI